MEAVVTSLVAVFGTLLGSVVTHLFQQRTARRSEEFTRSERVRQERIDAYCAFGGALANYRRGQLDYWFAKHDGRSVEAEVIHEMKRETQRLRAAAMEAMFRAQLLTRSGALSSLGQQAFDVTNQLTCTDSRDELDPLRDASRLLIYEFIAASGQHVPGSDE